jgi:uncharacterized membrane protein YhaH (DUF805 family)
MSADLPLVAQMLIPNGRCRRRGLLIAAIYLLTGQLALLVLIAAGLLAATSPLTVALKCLALWISTTLSAKRLHDIGHSGWWMLGAVAGLVVWSVVISLAGVFIAGPVMLDPTSIPAMISFAVIMAPVLAGLWWLHTAPGEPGTNRFGPCPDGFGMSLPDGFTLPAAFGLKALKSAAWRLRPLALFFPGHKS